MSVVALIRLDDCGAFIGLITARISAYWNNKVHRLCFSVQLRGDLDLLSSSEKETDRNTRHSGHFSQIEETH